MENININYKYMVTKFELNTVLHHFIMPWIIDTNQQLEYGIDKHDPDCILYGP